MPIHKADESEISIIIDLLKRLYTELGEEAESVRFLTHNLVQDMIRSGKTEIYLAKHNNEKIVGILTLTECQSIYAGGKYGLLDEMYVLPEFRSAEIGKGFVDKAVAVANEKKWKRIDVTTPLNSGGKEQLNFIKAGDSSIQGKSLSCLYKTQ